MHNRPTVLFVDEVHRFNKSQQDAFLPHIEDGTIFFIGATTENPSFEIISPLLSRCQIYILELLTTAEIESILKTALKDKERGLGTLTIETEQDGLKYIAVLSNGDARVALNILELVVSIAPDDKRKTRHITMEFIREAVQKKHLLYDKSGEEHYNLISALHKSMRGSDPDAALYWLARILAGGEDPLYIARRIVRFASEDIGNADPQALSIAVAAKEAVHFVGQPEGELALAQANGTLTRNFMGYTVQAAPDLVAFGVSGIGDVAGAFAQNEKKLARYYRALDEGRHDEVMYHVGRPGDDHFVPRLLGAWGIDGHNSHTNVCSASARTTS